MLSGMELRKSDSTRDGDNETRGGCDADRFLRMWVVLDDVAALAVMLPAYPNGKEPPIASS